MKASRRFSYVNVISICAFSIFSAITQTRALSAAEIGNPDILARNKPRTAAAGLHIGDKINLAVFERIEHEEDKWASQQERSPNLSRSFVQRAEVSGERVIQDDGTISLPFLGQLPVAGLTNAELETAVAKAFEQTFHRSAFVTVLSVDHKPIYIVGPVKNAGSYKYVAGMTVLHAIALAGGMERPTTETWQAIEAVREETKVEHARVSATRMLARLAILRAERDGTAPSVPPRLAQLLGETEAAAIINDERALRSLVVSTRRAREAALRSAVESAKSELDSAKDRIAPLESNIKLRTERLNAMSSLSSTGVASKAQLTEVQTALFDVQGRKQEAVAALSAAKHRLEQAEEELTRFRLENQTQLEVDITEADKDIATNINNIESGKETLKAIQANLSSQLSDKKGPLKFEIIRRTADVTKIIQADEISELDPGDLVRVKTPSSSQQAQVPTN